MEYWGDAFTPSSISRGGEMPALGEAEDRFSHAGEIF